MTKRRPKKGVAESATARVIPSGARVLFDTAPMIYWFEGHALAERFASLFERVAVGELDAIITPVTLAELAVGPLSGGRQDIAERYHRAITSSPWRLRPMDAEVALLAARLRAEHRLRLPDAIQLATAIIERCDALVTHDRDFPDIPGLIVHR